MADGIEVASLHLNGEDGLRQTPNMPGPASGPLLVKLQTAGTAFPP